MNLPLISVVVPAYNGEEYIEECLNSILNQTFRDWECIIVDDSSTDNTLSIIETFVAKDKRFSCYVNPNSGSAKTPMDVGISYAKSDWVTVVYHDDFIDNDVLEKLYARALETKADIVYPKMKLFNNESHQYMGSFPKDDFDMNSILTGSEAVMLTIPRWIIGANGGLIKKKLWNMRSTVNVGIKHMNADEYDTRELLIKANRVTFENVVYHYRRHSESITKKISIKLFESLITNKMLENLLFEHFGKESSEAFIVNNYRMDHIIWQQQFLFKIGSKLSSEDRKKAQKMIKEHYLDIDKKNVFREKFIKRILLTHGFVLFKTVLMVYGIFYKIFYHE